MKLRTLIILPLAILAISGCTQSGDNTDPKDDGKATTPTATVTPSSSGTTIEPYKSVAEIRNGQEVKQASINARVVSKGPNRFVAYDGTGLILCYGASQTGTVEIGEKYTIAGDLAMYDNTLQFSQGDDSSFTVTAYSGNVPEFNETPTSTTSIDPFANKNIRDVEYVTIPEVILYKNGNYINSEALSGDLTELSVSSLSNFVGALDGTSKDRPWTYCVTGFLTGYNSSSRRVSLMASTNVTKVDKAIDHLVISDQNSDMYTLTSVYDNDNGLVVKANYENDMIRTLNADEYTYNVYDEDNNEVDTSVAFPNGGDYKVIVHFGSIDSNPLSFSVEASTDTIISMTANQLGERNEWKTGNTSNKTGTMDDVISLSTEGSGTGKWSSNNGTWSITQKATSSGAGKDGGYLEITAATGYEIKWIKVTYSPNSGDTVGHFEHLESGVALDMEEGCSSYKDFVKGESEDIENSVVRIREIAVSYTEAANE